MGNNTSQQPKLSIFIANGHRRRQADECRHQEAKEAEDEHRHQEAEAEDEHRHEETEAQEHRRQEEECRLEEARHHRAEMIEKLRTAIGVGGLSDFLGEDSTCSCCCVIDTRMYTSESSDAVDQSLGTPIYTALTGYRLQSKRFTMF